MVSLLNVRVNLEVKGDAKLDVKENDENLPDEVENDYINWEEQPLINLAESNNLYAFKHLGFWHPMDTLRDKNYLESLWQKENTPWQKW